MTREYAWKVLKCYYNGHAVDPQTLLAAEAKINHRRVIRPHPIPAHVREKMNAILLLNLGKAIGRLAA